MKSLAMSLEEFTARRRDEQTDIEAAIRAEVERALDRHVNTHGWDELLEAMTAEFIRVYEAETGEAPPSDELPSRAEFNELRETLRKTNRPITEHTAERITRWLATWILSVATYAASETSGEDFLMEWVHMDDDAVRTAHRKTGGQKREPGKPFDVDGVEMPYPGWPGAPIELWINCRCTLRPVLVAEFASEKPWDGSASRFTEEQWKKSCILHVCDGMEKSCHKLPIREPGGALSRAGVHAAASRIGQVDAPPEKIASAKSALRGAYKQLGESPPDSLAASGSYSELNEGAGMTEKTTADADVRVPWHGVLAPEGIRSGDGRKFKEGSLRHRDLPLPLTWQKISDDGHKGNVTVATIEEAEVVDGKMRASGFFLAIPEADEVVGLIGEFGRFGVSVDADDATFEVDEDAEEVVFTDARVCSACIVSIPAFAEAWVALGTWADDEVSDEAECKERDEDGNCIDTQVGTAPNYEQVPASGEVEAFADVAPGRTEDGPGWLTHPVDTDRLRDYWVRGPGAAKIGWGTPGDFDRCRVNVAEYVKPQHINGYCANRHYDALGIWPGRNAHAAHTLGLAEEEGEGVHLVASAGWRAPSAFFENPNLTEPTPLTITDDGRVFGHAAEWTTCHIGYEGFCQTPPHSHTNYAHFLLGDLPLDNGDSIPAGNLTIGGGHAPDGLRSRAAMAHYDSTSTVFAYVTCGEDEHGIWFSGCLKPGLTDEQITEARMAKISGDWRDFGNPELDMIAAHAVNTPGFPIPRIRVAASNGKQVSLVAAGIVDKPEPKPLLDVEALAAAVVSHMQAQQRNREKMAALAARLKGE